MSARFHRFLGIWKILKSLRHKDTYKAMEHCDVVLCCADSDRADDYEGKAYSKILDSFAERLVKSGIRVQRFAWPYSQLTGCAAWGYAHSANRRFFWSLLWSKGRKVLGLKPAAESMEVNFYSHLISQTGCRSLAGIGLPSTAIRAAKMRGIKSLEILHGYGYSSVPWGWGSAAKETLPDVVITFDPLSAKTFGSLAINCLEVAQIENLWYRKFRDKSEFDRLPPSWRREQNWIPKGKKTVLVSMSWGYDGDHGIYPFFAGILKNGLFPEELVDAIQLAGDEYYWIFRLHPVQLRGERSGRYRKILRNLCGKFKNCEWEIGTTIPLPLLLRSCHAHISMISMTAYDAAFMGVRSLMLCPTLRSGGANELMFADLKQRGYLELGSFDANAIVSWLQSAGPMAEQLSYDVQSDMAEIRALVL